MYSSEMWGCLQTTSPTMQSSLFYVDTAVLGSRCVSSFSGYAARVEFGLKLGYTESLVQAALQKLGPSPEQNELLEELIKLGAQAPRQQDLAPEGGDEGDSTVDTPADDALSLRLRPIVIDGSNVAMR